MSSTPSNCIRPASRRHQHNIIQQWHYLTSELKTTLFGICIGRLVTPPPPPPPPHPPSFQHYHYRPSKLETTLFGICAVGKFVKTPMPPHSFLRRRYRPGELKITLFGIYICILCLESVSENWCKLYSPAATFSVGVTAPVNSK